VATSTYRAASAAPQRNPPRPWAGQPSAGGTSITNGGVNTNLGAGKFSSADQQVVSLGGTAGRRGLNVVDGGANITRGVNLSLGGGSVATQRIQNLTTR
jgi:hypothetical protein